MNSPSDHRPISELGTHSLESLPRTHPIPPPSHPRQYRAIGLVRGQYNPNPDKLTKGILTDHQGSQFQAVLLGRLISLVKKHLDLTQEHLWVVYPRSRQEDDSLHLQMVGVWSPQTLNSADLSESSESIHDGYFSIRGEAIFATPETQTVVIKIRQTAKNPTDKPKFFKIKLRGVLPGKPIGRFWDLQAELESNQLVIKQANDLGFAKVKPKKSLDRDMNRKPLPKSSELKPDRKPMTNRPKPTPSRRPPQQS